MVLSYVAEEAHRCVSAETNAANDALKVERERAEAEVATRRKMEGQFTEQLASEIRRREILDAELAERVSELKGVGVAQVGLLEENQTLRSEGVAMRQAAKVTGESSAAAAVGQATELAVLRRQLDALRVAMAPAAGAAAAAEGLKTRHDEEIRTLRAEIVGLGAAAVEAVRAARAQLEQDNQGVEARCAELTAELSAQQLELAAADAKIQGMTERQSGSDKATAPAASTAASKLQALQAKFDTLAASSESEREELQAKVSAADSDVRREDAEKVAAAATVAEETVRVELEAAVMSSQQAATEHAQDKAALTAALASAELATAALAAAYEATADTEAERAVEHAQDREALAAAEEALSTAAEALSAAREATAEAEGARAEAERSAAAQIYQRMPAAARQVATVDSGDDDDDNDDEQTSTEHWLQVRPVCLARLRYPVPFPSPLGARSQEANLSCWCCRARRCPRLSLHSSLRRMRTK